METRNKNLKNILIFLSILLLCSWISLYVYSFIKDVPPFIFSILNIFAGIILLSMFIYGLYLIGKLDFDYIKDVIIGVSAGLTVWILSEINFDLKNGVLISLDKVILKLIIAIFFLIYGYIIYFKSKKT